MANEMLTVESLSVRYSGVTAVHDESFAVQRGEIVAVVGANGAGKSSLLRALVGLVPKKAGAVTFNGADITGLPTYEIVRRGVSLVPETREIFPLMSCRDNLRCGLLARRDILPFREAAAPVLSLFPRLGERLQQRAGTLSGGEQQMLAIGRALIQDPALILLDEPSLGLSPSFADQLFEKILEIRKAGKTVLMVEQKARLALEIADRALVLSLGRITHSGTSGELRAEETVQQLYFGN